MRTKGSKNHGLSKTPFYQVWINMRNRCFYKKDKKYKHYGGSGIIVCDEWLDFLNFRDDMHESYLSHKIKHNTTTIERVDTNGNYCPKNCCWATREEQSLNRRKPSLHKPPSQQECAKAANSGQFICKRCAHAWWPRSNVKPQLCPACKSRKWEQQKKAQ